jgi:DNA-binding transcriptional MerR regulator
MKITMEKIKMIGEKLDDLPKIDVEQNVSKYETVKILAEQILSARKRGYTFEQISEFLKGEGLELAIPTLKSYLQRANPKKRTSRTKKQKIKQTTDNMDQTDQKPNEQVASKLENNTDMKAEPQKTEFITEPEGAMFDVPPDTKNI